MSIKPQLWLTLAPLVAARLGEQGADQPSQMLEKGRGVGIGCTGPDFDRVAQGHVRFDVGVEPVGRATGDCSNRFEVCRSADEGVGDEAM